MTTLPDDQLMLIAAALAATLLTALLLSLWLGISSRRALTATHEQLEARQAELATVKAELTATNTRFNTLLQEHTQLQTQQREREDRHLEQIQLLNETRENLKKEFENLANRIFEDKGKSFTSTSQASLEALLKPFREQITGFQTRINEVHSESLRGNTILEKEIQKVLEVGLEMNSQASNRTEALNAHAQAVRNHIDDLASKNYANLPGIGSPDFVLMFMPIEPAYIEAMKHNKDLFNYGYKKGVIMVSHTTLMPILRTVANLWMIEQGNREAKEISSRAGDIYNQVCLVAERLNKLGNTLRTANNHYNETVTGLVGKQGLHGKIERFQHLSTRASKEMVSLEPIHDEIENDRLDSVTSLADKDPLLSRIEESSSAPPEAGPMIVKKNV